LLLIGLLGFCVGVIVGAIGGFAGLFNLLREADRI